MNVSIPEGWKRISTSSNSADCFWARSLLQSDIASASEQGANHRSPRASVDAVLRIDQVDDQGPQSVAGFVQPDPSYVEGSVEKDLTV